MRATSGSCPRLRMAQCMHSCDHQHHSLQPRLKGLPAWYQALAVTCGLLAIIGLWLTHLLDPGFLQPSSQPGKKCSDCL